jgi:hypothetical protein
MFSWFFYFRVHDITFYLFSSIPFYILLAGLVLPMMRGGFWMKDIQEIMFTRGMPSNVMFWIGRTIHHHLLLWVFGHNQGGEVMKKIIHLIGNLGDMRNRTLIPTMRLMPFMIMRMIQFRNLISFGMTIAVWITIVIMDLTGLLGLGAVTMMIMLMMIMTIGPAFLIKTGRVAVTGIMTMVGIVMILIMTEAVREMVIGGGVNPVIRDVQVGKEIRVHIEGMSAPGLGGVMITLDQGLLEEEAMVEVIERTAMMMIDMKGLISEGSVKTSVIVSNILWYALIDLLYLAFYVLSL